MPFDDVESTYKLYKDSLEDKVEGINNDSFVVIDPKLAPEEAAKDYAEKLRQLYKDETGASKDQVFNCKVSGR